MFLFQITQYNWDEDSTASRGGTRGRGTAVDHVIRATNVPPRQTGPSHKKNGIQPGKPFARLSFPQDLSSSGTSLIALENRRAAEKLPPDSQEKMKIFGTRRRISLRTMSSSSLNSHRIAKEKAKLMYEPTSVSLDKTEHRVAGTFDKNTVESSKPSLGIREKLYIWQQGQPPELRQHSVPTDFRENILDTETPNLVTRSLDHDDVQVPQDEEDLDMMDDLSAYNDPDQPLSNMEKDRTSLHEGDLVEITTAQQPLLGIFIRYSAERCLIYTMAGKWFTTYPKLIKFTVCSFVDSSELQPLLPYLPDAEDLWNSLQTANSDLPRNLGAALIEKMMSFYQASNRVYRKNADSIDNAYTAMAHETRLTSATTPEIARKVLSLSKNLLLTDPVLWAVHRALSQNELGFFHDKFSHRYTHLWMIIPKEESETYEKVRKWVREYQELVITCAKVKRSSEKVQAMKDLRESVLSRFIWFARRAVVNSRKRRKVIDNGGVGPSTSQPGCHEGLLTQEVFLHKFEDDCKSVVRFLEFWSAKSLLPGSSMLGSIGPMILRETGLYEGQELSQNTCITLLQEMGVFTPWQERVALDDRIELPGVREISRATHLHKIAERSALEWIPKDSMKDLRKDWKSLDVFCVDHSNTMDVDDGFSIEEIPGHDQQIWIHVHIANPTAFFGKYHPIAKFAHHSCQSTYLGEKTYSMMSRNIAIKSFSLIGIRPALTFSAKLNIDGNIIEVKITPSVVRNVTNINPETLSSELGLEDDVEDHATVYTVGTNPVSPIPQGLSEKVMAQSLSAPQKANLKKMITIASKRFEKRLISKMPNTKDDASTAIPFGSAGTLPFHNGTRRIDGDPTITFRAVPFQPLLRFGISHRPVQLLVQEMMLIASEVGGLWCKQRGIPVIYRGAQTENIQAMAEFQETRYKPAIKKLGRVPYSLARELFDKNGSLVLSSSPVYHEAIGVDTYTRVTSPIRRYSDLIAHWQIEAALRREAESGESLVGNTDDSFLPYSRADVEVLMRHVEHRERSISRSQSLSQKHWISNFFFRAHYFKEAPLPEIFRVFITARYEEGQDLFKGIAHEFGVEVLLLPNSASREADGFQAGDWWEAKISGVRQVKAWIDCAPVRLVYRPEIDEDGVLEIRNYPPGVAQ